MPQHLGVQSHGGATLRNPQLTTQGWAPLLNPPWVPRCLFTQPIHPQGDTPRQRAEKAQDTELAAYLASRQHYQMIQREDQETAV